MVADPIPGRCEVLLSSIIFDIAAVLLLLEFTSIGYGFPMAKDDLTGWNWLGCWSCVGWFIGFALLIDWTVFSTFPVWGFSRQALAGATLKLIASVLFCIQPFSYLAGFDPLNAGNPWSNFVGICFFHAGNMLNAICMCPMIDCSAPLLANAPPIGMIIFATATWFLVIADGIFYFALPTPSGPGVDVRSAIDVVSPFQVTGATLLLVGSLLYTFWAAMFARVKESEALLASMPAETVNAQLP